MKIALGLGAEALKLASMDASAVASAEPPIFTQSASLKSNANVVESLVDSLVSTVTSQLASALAVVNCGPL